MKSICNLGFVLALLTVSLLFAGCASQHESFFSDNSNGNSGITSAPAPSSTSAPAADADTNMSPEVAKFHIGDTVTVTFSGLPTDILPHTEPIKEDGTITLPDIGKVTAAGKTAGQLQNEIHDLYVPSLYRHLTVTISSGDRVYYVRGEVKGGGRIIYSTEMTVSKAIAAAGDFTDFANHKNVLLIRANGKQIKVNCDKILDGEAPDPPVYPGDQIVVKRRLF